MAKSVQKITLSQSRDIPFNKLVLSQSNVRRIKAGVSIEELAQDIARRTLLQSLSVRPVLDGDGSETGMFEVPAGGRRYRALELLVKQKRLARTAPIPCVVRTEGLAEEDSLAENVQRAPLHPLDQFRAFRDLREKGMSEEEIAAAFFVSVQVVKQRLKLASVSSRLLDVYAEDGMTLDQLMAFTVNPDHDRQEQVWEALQRSHNKEPYPDVVSALVDAERKAQFEEAGSHYESSYYLTFLYLPPAESAAVAERLLYEGSHRSAGSDAREVLSSFIDRTNRVLQLVEGFMPECGWLDDEQTLTYLHSTVSTRRHRVRVPEIPMYLDALLADQPLTGGLEPMLGEAHVRVLTVVGFPTATTPGILDDLNRLAFPYRWSTRAIMLDKTDATKLLTRIRRQWFAKRKSIAAILKEVMTNEASTLLDTDAHNKAMDADSALQELGSDQIGEAFVTATVTVWDRDPSAADEKLRLVEKVIQGRDFTCMAETVNAVEAWLGSLPGQVYANVRQPPVSTLNLAHMIPLSAVWAGEVRDSHFKAPPLFFGKTEGSTPFRFSLHVGDVGHTLIVGPTGSGKSVLLALMALQFRRYPQAQIFAFDFGGSIRAAAIAMGGDWHDLGGAVAGEAESVALQPLARIDDIAERGWASDWITSILTRERIEVTPETKDHIWSALTSLASAPVGERTLTGLSVLLQSNALKRALQPFCLGGPHERLLDSEGERLGEASVQVFETDGLIGTSVALAVLAYLFHRIEDRFDGRPTLLIIDEGWLALDDANFAGKLREWLKTLRKKNASVVFATQSLADVDGSAIAPAIIESCPTRILLPNDRAIEPQIMAVYQRFGLNDRQIEILARATPKRDYYCQSRRGNRLFDLGLGEIALCFAAASSKTDQALIERVLAEHGRNEFVTGWLRARDLSWACNLIPQLAKKGGLS